MTRLRCALVLAPLVAAILPAQQPPPFVIDTAGGLGPAGGASGARI